MDRFGIDSHKMMYHPERVAAWRRAAGDWSLAQSVYPLYVELSPVGACNHRCTFCAVDYLGYKPNFLDVEIFDQRFYEMSDLGVRSVMFAGEGEPLIHKQAGRLFSNARSAGLDLALTTNGVLMREDFCDRSLADFSWIKISCNAGTRDGYARIHRTKESDFDRVIENVARAVETKRRNQLGVAIGVQLVLIPENEGEVEELARLCRDEIRPDYLVVKPYSQHLSSLTRRYEELRYDADAALADRLAGYEDEDFRVIFRARTMQKLAEDRGYERCSATPFMWAYVMSTGELYACSAFLNDERFNLGNLHERSFQEIWQGPERKRCFEFVENELDISECRVNCRMDEVNRYLSDLRNPSPHVNFI